mmetsp:Transcript_11844/g.34190  ORF Transcript_11844/g.34190 Transcript_11844/m.34190 type:complete len:413 (-) Transcript_11844:291-1529(-)|eukprot:CAMPEP_0119552662 /NCGR_PEP_ID=MMETSP1352-20130426/5587_1 /TAXON_ID=265584 /ORGANISM="Stauroneis constricta, Strain CCMP1120" /LENGTH=412 /DNA_ID=CAMNT_0007598923 /DNA_START=137 /DNA_END=1375 /DNA_ORIENTATION=-
MRTSTSTSSFPNHKSSNSNAADEDGAKAEDTQEHDLTSRSSTSTITPAPANINSSSFRGRGARRGGDDGGEQERSSSPPPPLLLQTDTTAMMPAFTLSHGSAFSAGDNFDHQHHHHGTTSIRNDRNAGATTTASLPPVVLGRSFSSFVSAISSSSPAGATDSTGGEGEEGEERKTGTRNHSDSAPSARPGPRGAIRWGHSPSSSAAEQAVVHSNTGKATAGLPTSLLLPPSSSCRFPSLFFEGSRCRDHGTTQRGSSPSFSSSRRPDEVRTAAAAAAPSSSSGRVIGRGEECRRAELLSILDEAISITTETMQTDRALAPGLPSSPFRSRLRSSSSYDDHGEASSYHQRFLRNAPRDTEEEDRNETTTSTEAQQRMRSPLILRRGGSDCYYYAAGPFFRGDQGDNGGDKALQ